MRVLCSSTPESSHLAPIVPLARELHARGHEVLLACSPRLGRWVEGAGLRATPCGLDLDPDHLNFADAGIVLEVPDDLTPETMDAWATRAVFAEIFAPTMAADLRRVADEFRPDIMVRDRGEYAGWAVGRAMQVPVVTVTFGKVADPAFDFERASDALQQLLAQQGVDPDPGLGSLYAGPVLVPAPPSYSEPEAVVLPSVSFVQPLVHDTSREEDLPRYVEELGDRPVVYVTLGNIFNTVLDGKARFEAMIEALIDEPVDAIVTVGRAVDPEDFTASPNIHVEGFIPQSRLLPHVDLVMCHGGYNTVIGALHAGKPLVITPISADQPEHARQCQRLGAALVVDPNPIDSRKLRNALRTVLADRTYADAATRVAEEIMSLPDLATTAAIIERAAQ